MSLTTDENTSRGSTDPGCTHSTCRTQMHHARLGEVTEAMRTVAEKEGVDPELVRDEVAAGHLVIPANIHHRSLIPMGIGIALRAKINANLGTSAVTSDVNQELDVPPERLDALGEALQPGQRDRSAGIGHVDQVEANTANPGPVEALQLVIRNRIVDRGHASARRPAFGHGLQQRRVVGAVDAGLDDDRPFDAERAEHPEIRRQQGVGRRVDTVGRVAVAGCGAADMGVAVTGTRRQGDARSARLGIGRRADGRLRAEGAVPSILDASQSRCSPLPRRGFTLARRRIAARQRIGRRRVRNWGQS